jgi:hypothetical protein
MCVCVCVCVFWCAHVVVVFRQLHRWQLYARNCAFRKKEKRCNKSFVILKKGVKKDKRNEKVV